MQSQDTTSALADIASKSEPEDDASLLRRWGEGDAGAGDALIRRHFSTVHRFLRGKVDSDAELEELVQDTLLACVEARHRYRAEASFRTFLLSIARHRLIDRYRARRLVLPISTALRDSATSPTQRMVKGQNVERLGRAIHELPAQLRRILELVYWHELDVPAVARRLGLPLNTVYSHLHRARVSLRSALHDSITSAEERAAR